jgi:hypothetical protein
MDWRVQWSQWSKCSANCGRGMRMRYTQCARSVERLYCKRPIQCLASSEILKILTPPLTARRVCTPPPLVRGEDTLAEWRGGGWSIVRKTPDTALYSMYVSTLWPGPSNSVFRSFLDNLRPVIGAIYAVRSSKLIWAPSSHSCTQ